MPGAPNLKRNNPLKKLIADAVYDCLKLMHQSPPGAHNIDHIDVRRISDLRTEIYVVPRINSGKFLPRQFTIQVIEHQ